MDFVYKVLAVFSMAALTGLAAQVRIPLPFTPVPITGQVLPALLAGFILGRWYGGLSQLTYAVLGGLGIPWFAPKAGEAAFTRGGVDVLIGPTGGYIAGFIVAALIIGHFTDTYVRFRTFRAQLILMLLGVLVIYTMGAAQFYMVASNTPGLKSWVLSSLGASELGFRETMLAAVLPFIPGDILKAFAAAVLGGSLLPKEPIGSERDR